MPLYTPATIQDWANPTEYITEKERREKYLNALDDYNTVLQVLEDNKKINYALDSNFPDSGYLNWTNIDNTFFDLGGTITDQVENNTSTPSVTQKNQIVKITYPYLPILDKNQKNSDLSLYNYIFSETTYNQYIENYENKISSLNNNKLLPFFHYFCFSKYYDDKNSSLDPKLLKDFAILERDNFYFENFVDTNTVFKNSSIIDKQVLKDSLFFSNKKDFFPFYNILNIAYYNKSFFVDRLDEYNLNNEMLNYIAYVTNLYDKKSTEADKFLNNLPYDYFVNGQLENLKIDLNTFFNILKFKNNTSYYYIHSNVTKNFNFYTNNYSKQQKNKSYYKIFGDLLERFTKTNSLKINKQVIAFQVKKIDSNGGTISDHFFLNHTDIENFIYVDTQVKYEENSQYVIYGFILNFVIDKGVGYPVLIRAKLNNNPVTAIVKDDPPLAPIFDVYIEKNEKNTLSFITSMASGGSEEYFLPLNGSDPIKNLQIFENDDYPKKIELFLLEEEPTSYKDFRNAKVFSSENSFLNLIIAPNKFYYITLRTVDVHDQISNPSHVIKIKLVKEDNLEYLEKYSYASYELKINASEVLFNPWVLNNKDDIRNKEEKISKNFKKYLQIKPSDTQLLLDNLKDVLPKDVYKLSEDIQNKYDSEIHGVQNGESGNLFNTQIQTMFGKKYKLRIKSKNSGKIIDVNFSYKLKN